MKKNILLKGPVLSQSGYGQQTRFALKALMSCPEEFQIFIINTSWGSTSWIVDDDLLSNFINQRIQATADFLNKGGEFDINLQVTIPNEVEQNAPINILYTAGIETTKVAPQWLEKLKFLDKMIVVSNHSKQVFENTEYQVMEKDTKKIVGTLKSEIPIDVVNYSVSSSPKGKKINLDLDCDFNFLTVAMWSPRKAIEETILWFVEEFFDREIGLVVKTNFSKNCLLDRLHTTAKISALLALPKYKGRKCKVYLLHGNIPDKDMMGIYRHPKIKAYVSLAHGEGFGLPIFEAAQNELPIVTMGWSGPCDFLYINKEAKFAEVDYTLAPLSKEAVWEGVLEADSMWAYADQGSAKMKMRDVVQNYERYLQQSVELSKYLKENFSEKKKYREFVDSVLRAYEISEDDLEKWMNNMELLD